MSRCRQQVRNKFSTSRCNGIWENTRHNRHTGLYPRHATTCYGLVTDLQQRRYGETGVMDFGKLVRGKLLTCCDLLQTWRLCCGLVTDLLSPVHTVAEKWDCHFCATVSLLWDSLTFLRQCGQGFSDNGEVANLMMGYGAGDLRTGAVWPAVGLLPRHVCAGCGQWPVWPAAPGPWRQRIRGGTAGPPAWPPAYGVHDDALYKSTAFTFFTFFVTDLLTCYGETVVMDFGLKWTLNIKTRLIMMMMTINCLTPNHRTFSEASSDVTRHMCGVQNSLRRMNTPAMMLNAANWRPWYTSWKINIITKPFYFLKKNN